MPICPIILKRQARRRFSAGTRESFNAMKTTYSFILSALSASVLLTGCGKPKPEPEPVAAEPPKPLIVATEATFPPYEYRAKDGRIAGVDVDICQAIADRLGRPLVMVDTNFAAVLLAVQVGYADLAASAITIIEERKTHLDFSIPYMTSGTVIISRKGEEYRDAESAKGRRIGVQSGTTSDNFCVEELGVKPERYFSNEDAASALKAGKVDLVISDLDPAKTIVEANDSLVISSDSLTLEEYGIAVGKGRQDLLESVNAVIDELVKGRKVEEFIAAHAKRDSNEVK